MVRAAPKVKGLTVRFSADEAATLDRLVEVEDLPGGAIMRRALRLYAERAGVSIPPAPVRAPVKKPTR